MKDGQKNTMIETKCENCKYFTAFDENKGVCSVHMWIDGKLSVNRYVPLQDMCGLYEQKEEQE